MQISDLADPKILELVVSSLLTLLTTFILYAWKSVRNDLKRTRVYHYNVMILMFRLLQKLNPDQTPEINRAMIDFMRDSSPTDFNPSKSNGKYYG